MRRSREQVLMDIAYAVSARGTCSRLKVGAVVARDFRVITTGYNGVPGGMDHCDHKQTDQGCKDSVHAEANALVFAARHALGVDGCSLYTTHSPCVECAKLIINAGIREVYYAVAYRDPSGIQLLKDAGIAVSAL